MYCSSDCYNEDNPSTTSSSIFEYRSLSSIQQPVVPSSSLWPINNHEGILDWARNASPGLPSEERTPSHRRRASRPIRLMDMSTLPPAPAFSVASSLAQPSNATQTPRSSERARSSPDKLHPTLSSWLKNINKLDSLINRLQELASSARADHRSQLFNKVAALRETSKEQQERCIEFLQLSEDYANKYLLDLDAEIRQQSTLLDNLEERLEAAKKLHGDAIDLQMLYESGTAASMNDLVTGKAVSRCPQRLKGKLLRLLIFRYFAAASTG